MHKLKPLPRLVLSLLYFTGTLLIWLNSYDFSKCRFWANWIIGSLWFIDYHAGMISTTVVSMSLTLSLSTPSYWYDIRFLYSYSCLLLVIIVNGVVSVCLLYLVSCKTHTTITTHRRDCDHRVIKINSDYFRFLKNTCRFSQI